jgi:23S rRNA-/tRNA-specific pseudouridylate synthase
MPPLIVLKESPHEVVVFKPAGVASELRDDRRGVSVRSLVARQFPGTDPKLPHRLDRVTRGLLLVCLTRESVAFHNAALKAHRWEKYYLARVAAPPGGRPDACLGEHRAFLRETAGRARLVHAGGQPARQEILAAAPVPGRADRWHLLIRLLTGRFHQIRVMCAALGLPLAGDPLYDPAARDPAEFYLEHIILKYEDFDTRTPATVFLRELEERGALAPELAALLAEIAARKGPVTVP